MSESYTGASVVATALTLNGPRGPVYQDVNFLAVSGQLVAVVGDTGSGRTSLLLTLAGRMRPSSGDATVDGESLSRRAGAVRKAVGLGPVAGVTDLDGGLTAEEHLTERLLLRRHGRGARRRLAAALDDAGLTHAELPLRADALTALQSFRVALAAALLGAPRVLVVDDVGDRLSSDEATAAWQALRALADAGLTVLAATREAPPEADLVVRTRPNLENNEDKADPADAADAADAADQPEQEQTRA